MKLSPSELKQLDRFRRNHRRSEKLHRCVTVSFVVLSFVLLSAGIWSIFKVRPLLQRYDISLYELLALPEVTDRGLAHHEVVVLNWLSSFTCLCLCVVIVWVGLVTRHFLLRERRIFHKLLIRLIQLGEIAGLEDTEEPRSLSDRRE